MSRSDAIRAVLQHLADATVYTAPTNVETNRKLWNQYARDWDRRDADGVAAEMTASSSTTTTTTTTTSTTTTITAAAAVTAVADTIVETASSGSTASSKDKTISTSQDHDRPPAQWVLQMAKNVGRTARDLTHIGDEWSDEQSLHTTLDHYLFPLLRKDQCVAEIGVGGGRIASRVAPRVQSLTCFDLSENMLSRARHSLAEHTNVDFHLLAESATFRPIDMHRYDVVYCFDVLPHIDLHAMWQYFRVLPRLMRDPHTARIFLSTSNLLSPLGWERFAKQSRFTEGGFYFVTPDLVEQLITKAGLIVIERSSPDPAHTANLYVNRDTLWVLGVAPSETSTSNNNS